MNVPTLFLFCRIGRRSGSYWENTSRLSNRVTSHVLIRLKPNSRNDLFLLLYPDETIRIDLIFFLVPKQFIGLKMFSLQAFHLHLTNKPKQPLFILIVSRVGHDTRFRTKQRVKFLYVNSLREIPIGLLSLAIDQPLFGVSSIACHARV